MRQSVIPVIIRPGSTLSEAEGSLPACRQAAIGVPGRSECGVIDGAQLVDPLR